MHLTLQPLARLAVILFLATSVPSAATDLRLPDPELSPAEVVRIQLNALQIDVNGNGIATTYQFASTTNKMSTGPLEKFPRLFDNSQYRPMLNHRKAGIKLLHDDCNQAELVTSIVDKYGKLHWYRFKLSCQLTLPNYNCWMTDTVMREQRSEHSA